MNQEPSSSSPPPLPSSSIVGTSLTNSKKSGCLLQVLLMSPVWTGIGALAAVAALVITMASLNKANNNKLPDESASANTSLDPKMLFQAIDNKDSITVKSLLHTDPSLAKKSDNEGSAPLLAMWFPEYESGLQRMQMAAALIEGGCDVNAVNPVGYYPIHFAVKNGDPTIVGTLVKNGADISARGNSDETVVHCLAWVHERNVLRELINMFLSRHPELMNAKTAQGCTALHYAADRGNLAFATELLRFKPDPTVLDDMRDFTATQWIQDRVDNGDKEESSIELLRVLREYEAKYPGVK